MSFWSTGGSSEAGFTNVTVYNFAVMFSKTHSASVSPEQKAKSSQFTGPLNVFWIENSCVFDRSCAIFADEVVTSHGPIEADKENIRQEPYSLPQGFMWDTLDLSNADVVSTVFVSVTKTHSVCLLELQLMIVFYIWELHKNERFAPLALAVVTYHQFIYKNCSSKIHF